MNNNKNSQNTIQITQDDLHLQGAPKEFGAEQIGALLGVAYVLAGIVAVVVLVIAGGRYLTANGESDKIQSAKNQMFYGIIGLVVVIAASAITQFVITNVTK